MSTVCTGCGRFNCPADDSSRQSYPDYSTALADCEAAHQRRKTINPAHYTEPHASGVECIELAEGLSFCLGNAVKYLYRAGRKGAARDDYSKAAWYLRRLAVQGPGWSDIMHLELALQDENGAWIKWANADPCVEDLLLALSRIAQQIGTSKTLLLLLAEEMAAE